MQASYDGRDFSVYMRTADVEELLTEGSLWCSLDCSPFLGEEHYKDFALTFRQNGRCNVLPISYVPDTSFRDVEHVEIGVHAVPIERALRQGFYGSRIERTRYGKLLIRMVPEEG